MTLSGGTLIANGDLTVSGTFEWTTGTLGGSGATVLEAAAVMNIQGPTTTGNHYATEHTIEGPGTVNWTEGAIIGGPLTVAADLNISGASTKYLWNGTINNARTAVWSGTGTLTLRTTGAAAEATFNNLPGALFEVQNDRSLFDSGLGTRVFNNGGTFRKTAGTGTTRFDDLVAFHNTGTVEVLSGTLQLDGEFPNFDGGTATLSGGTYLIAGTLKFTGADIAVNEATILLDGPAAAIVDLAGANALADFGANAAGASFTIQGGRELTTGVALTNAGDVAIGQSSTLSLGGGYTQTAGGTAVDGTLTTVGLVVAQLDVGSDRTAEEGRPFELIVPFTDPNDNDVHTAEIDWGDGTVEPGAIDEDADTTSGSHVYVDNDVHTISVHLFSDDGSDADDRFTITVLNVDPIIEPVGPQEVDEASTYDLLALYGDPGILDTHSRTIDWDDGTIEPATLTPAPGTIAGNHSYPDDDVLQVVVTVTDKDGGVGTEAFTLTVNNVPPVGNDDTAETDEDNSVGGNVLGNDTDVSPLDTLSVTGVDRALTLGNVDVAPDGGFTYDPNGRFEQLAAGEPDTDSFGYTVSDDDVVTDEDTSINITILGNDGDPDTADMLSVIAADGSSAAGAGVSVRGDGTVDYDPTVSKTLQRLEAGETFVDTFHYTIGDGRGGSDTAIVSVTVAGVVDLAEVFGRHVFYNGSSFDGRNPRATAEDDGAIAPGKLPLLPGETVGSANYTSYSDGLNGIMVDIDGLPEDSQLSADDFRFRKGSISDPESWQSTPPPTDIDVRSGDGVGGSGRVTMAWEQGAVTRGWLEVTVGIAGLDEPDVFYFANITGDADSSGAVDLSDFNLWNATKFTQVGLDAVADFDRSGAVDLSDFNIWNAHKFTSLATATNPVPPADAGQDLYDLIETIDELAWLRELEQSRSRRSSDASTLAAATADRLLATYWK